MRITLTAILSILYFTGFSQQLEEQALARDVNKNELSVNAFNLVTFGAIDVAYERIIDENSSWALEGFILALERESEDVNFFLVRMLLLPVSINISSETAPPGDSMLMGWL